jgi:hypothetical protein
VGSRGVCSWSALILALRLTLLKSKLEVEVPLRLTVNQSVRLGVEPLRRPHDQILVIIPQSSTRTLWQSFTSIHLVSKPNKWPLNFAYDVSGSSNMNSI